MSRPTRDAMTERITPLLRDMTRKRSKRVSCVINDALLGDQENHMCPAIQWHKHEVAR